MESKIFFEQTTLKDSENFFPKRSGINTSGQKLELSANYFSFKFNDPKRQVFYKYSVKIEPELPGDSFLQRRRLFNRVKTDLKEKLGHTIFNNTVIYSLQNYEDIIEVQTELKDSEYKLIIQMTNTIDAESNEAESLYKNFFSEMSKKINFVQLRKNFYNSKKAHFISNKLEVWPGFNSHVNSTQQGIMFNMNLTYRVIRPERAIEVMKNIPNLTDKEARHLQGTAVLTRYNGDRVHILEGIDFEKTPQSKFSLKENEISYLEYYDKKYGIKIHDKCQPLLKTKVKEQFIYLVPELCHITGLTDEMRANFNLMKELAVITKGCAAEKLEECRRLIEQFKNNQECQKSMSEWGLSISNEPLKLNAVRISSGNYIMHKTSNNSRFSFKADDTPDIDRKIQNEMYHQPELKTWAIFATNKDQQHAKTFKENMEQAFKSFNYPGNIPALFLVNSQNFRDWEYTIEKQIKPNIQNVQAVVLIIPGNRGKGALYNDLKKLLLGKYPVPNQVVLSGTIAKGKLYIYFR
jgi:aubergine-like protein